MQLYEHWTEVSTKLKIDGREEPAKFYGKSHQSLEDARRDALAQAKRVQNRIDGNLSDEWEYKIAIREEVLEKIDSQNVVTRNRYGAKVLNSENVIFIDVDHPRLGIFARLFGTGSKSKKEQIVSMVEKQTSRSRFRDLSIRIYETKAGVRLLVQGRQISPNSRESEKIMRAFNADELYAILCSKQQCYRARLTPKPYRMKVRGHRVRYPRASDQEQKLQTWLAEYEESCWNYATCRFVKDLGRFRPDEIVRYHDDVTGAHKNRPLA